MPRSATAAKRGWLITLEGIEGSGKSLQIRLLAEELGGRGVPLVVTREPGGTRFGQKLRSLLLESEGPPRAPIAELLVYLADRYQHLTEIVEPALAAGNHVLCDRYHDATRAYQGAARGVDIRLIDALASALRLRKPDRTLLLDLPVRTGIRRARGRNQQERSPLGRFEAESHRFHERVRAAYHEMVRQEPRRFHRIAAGAAPEIVHRRILAAVEPLLKRRPGRGGHAFF